MNECAPDSNRHAISRFDDSQSFNDATFEYHAIRRETRKRNLKVLERKEILWTKLRESNPKESSREECGSFSFFWGYSYLVCHAKTLVPCIYCRLTLNKPAQFHFLCPWMDFSPDFVQFSRTACHSILPQYPLSLAVHNIVNF